MKKKFVAMGLVFALSLTSVQLVGATTLSNARNQKSQAESNLSSVNDKIDQIEEQQRSLQAEIDKVDAKLVQVLVDLKVIKGEIADKKVELKKAESDLAAAKKKEAEQYEAMKTRIRYMYENGDSTFFTALLEANSFADVLNRVEFASKVYDADRNMLVEYQNTKVEVQNLVEKVQQEKEDLEENQESYKKEEKELNQIKSEKQASMDDFDAQLAQAESLASQYKATIDAQNEIISQELAAQQTASISSVTAGASSVANSSGSSSYNSSSSSDSGSGSNSGSGSSTSTADSSGSSSSKGDSSGSSSSSGSGQAVADYACQFVGNPYVWGGSSLTNGADCSGFVMSVYKNFGVSLPHSSSADRSQGYDVGGLENAQPGDIVCYSGHVGIYAGDGKLVHASTSKTGIIVSNANYRNVLAVRRIF